MTMISLQISDDILSKFDKVYKRLNYTTRSEAIRDAIVLFVEKNESENNEREFKRGVVSVTFKQDFDDLEMIAKIQHRFDDEIKSMSQNTIGGEIIQIYFLIGQKNRILDFKNEFNQIKYSKTNIMFF